MRRFSIDTCDAMQKVLGRKARDHFMMFDTPAELAQFAHETSDYRVHRRYPDSWVGNVTGPQAVDMATRGDLSGVAASNELLTRFERFSFETGRKAWSDDVCGSIPNVPAFIAGHPLAMRRRIRQDSAAAPIAIVVDLTTSARISADQIKRRGAAILALTRALSARRPVELWAGTGLDADNLKNAVWVFARIETAPLDLATAAHCLTHASFPRILCYDLSHKHHGYCGNWPYGTAMKFRDHMPQIIAPAFAHTAETLCLSSLHIADESVTNPEKWIESQLDRLAPVDLAA